MSTVCVLGLETSCDDTAAAIVEGCIGAGGAVPPGRILAQAILGQSPLHAPFGGVVPEIAARAHAERADLAIEAALDRSGRRLGDLDAIAVTAGPGLAPGLIAGVMTARGVAAARGLPLYPINHLEAHALSPRLAAVLAFPYLTLLASGGHCLFAATAGPDRHRVLGETRDDAPGEAYDKVARLLGLAQPGGPSVERSAAAGRPDRYSLPRPLVGRPGCDLSFSGLKAAVRRTGEAIIARDGGLDAAAQADLAASFEAALSETLVARCRSAMAGFAAAEGEAGAARAAGGSPVLAGCGGVLANRGLRTALAAACRETGFDPVFPAPELCTDNGAMVAWAAIERMGAGLPPPAAFTVRPRWPLESGAA